MTVTPVLQSHIDKCIHGLFEHLQSQPNYLCPQSIFSIISGTVVFFARNGIFFNTKGAVTKAYAGISGRHQVTK